jgi:polysaccharide biosynthesis protein PslH
MRILFVSHRFPYPPSAGSKVRAFQTIKHLSQTHEVVVASLARTDEEAEAGHGIAGHCADYMMARVTEPAAWARMITRLPTPEPASMGYFHSLELQRLIDARLARESFDLIVVHSSSVAPYVSRVSGIPKILDFVDMDSQKWLIYRHFKPFPLSLGYWLEGRKMEAAEKALAGQFDLCTCATVAEVETMQNLGVATPSDWFPNGVDLDYFSPSAEAYDPDAISFVGRMDYFPNQQAMKVFCNEVFPLIRRRRPGARLAIVGAEPSAEVRRLGEREGVTVTGTVADVRDYVRGSAANVAPLAIARGTQNKILESMAMGVPVVTSPAAAGGVDAVAGEHFLVAGSARETADQVLRVMEDPAVRRALAEAGRRRVETHHSWPGAMARLDGIIAACLERHRLGARAAAD